MAQGEESDSDSDDDMYEEAPTRLRVWMLTGLGFLIDSYDLFVINSVMVMLDEIKHDVEEYKSFVVTSILVGTIIGNGLLGVFADKFGRKQGLILSMLIILVGALGSSLSFSVPGLAISTLGMLTGWRLILGIGIGGEYPLSATYAAETSPTTKTRGMQVSATFCVQGFGAFLAAIVGYFASAQMGPSSGWRFCLGIITIPCAVLFVLRIRMPESTKFSEASKIAEPAIRSRLATTIRSGYLLNLIGTSVSWFLLDVIFYANGLFSTAIIKLAGSMTVTKALEYNVYLAMAALPGYFVAMAIIDKVGRVKLQLGGFLILSVVYLVIGVAYTQIVERFWLFICLYGLTFFLLNCGPNTTTFVIPSELFPVAISSTCHGISSASGKLGSVIGAALMSTILKTYSISVVMIICAVVSLLGAIVTFFCIKETAQQEIPTHPPPKYADYTMIQ